MISEAGFPYVTYY